VLIRTLCIGRHQLCLYWSSCTVWFDRRYLKYCGSIIAHGLILFWITLAILSDMFYFFRMSQVEFGIARKSGVFCWSLFASDCLSYIKLFRASLTNVTVLLKNLVSTCRYVIVLSKAIIVTGGNLALLENQVRLVDHIWYVTANHV
jgi:hypothetical protein